MTRKRQKIVGAVTVAACLGLAGLYAAGWRVVPNPSGKGFFIGRRVSYRNGRPAGKDGPAPSGPLQSLELLTPDPVISRNVDQDAFIADIKRVSDAVERVLARSPKEFPLELTVIVHPDRETENVVKVGEDAVPELAEGAADAADRLDKDMRTKTDDVAVRFHFIARIPAAGAPAPAPDVRYPRFEALKGLVEVRLDRYAHTFQNVDPRFEGVVAYGKALAGRKGKSLDEVAGKNPDFWRAVMEVVPQDPSIGFSMAYLCASRGLLRSAQAWLLVASPGMDAGVFGADLEKLKAAVENAENEIEPDIRKGIALHDAKKYDEAIAAYDAVAAAHPENAWALYEKSFSMMAKDPEGSAAAREGLYAAIRAVDPFYFEAYQGKVDAARKRQIAALLKDVQPFLKGPARDEKAFERFALGCEAMGQHGFAALAFWKLHVGRRDRAAFTHFTTNLVSLGLEPLVRLLKEDAPTGLPAAASAPSPAPAPDSPSPAPAAEPADDSLFTECAAEAGMFCSAEPDRPAVAKCLLGLSRRGLTSACRKALKRREQG